MLNQGLSRETWKKIGLAAAFLLVLAAPELLHAAIVLPAPRAAAPAQTASAKTFVPTCSAGQTVVDTRPDPAWVGASFGHDDCWAPPMPKVVDGYSASREQIVAGMAARQRYNVLADAYQRCIGNFLGVRKQAADKSGKPMDVALLTIENHRMAASEANKKKVAALTDNAINAFNEYGSQCE